MDYLLDTSVYSQRLRKEPVRAVVRRWKAVGDRKLAISLVTEGEVLFGLEKASSERLWRSYREYLDGRLRVLPIDHTVMAQYAGLRANLERGGRVLGDFDLLIAATAGVYGLRVATLNLRHFVSLPGIEVEDWSR